jgi:hypothetical protein
MSFQDPQYRKMMLWVLVALIASLVAAFLVVEWTYRHFGQ